MASKSFVWPALRVYEERVCDSCFPKRLEDAYFHSLVLTSGQYNAIIKLLEFFAKLLSLLANQIVLQEDETEPPLVRRARAYIVGHQADPIDLDNVAHAMHVSTFYFCKMFKKGTGLGTGLTFTEYLGRVRIDKANTLLLNPQLRISEIAYDNWFPIADTFQPSFSADIWTVSDCLSRFEVRGSQLAYKRCE